MPRDAPAWHYAARRAATEACAIYQLDQDWASPLSDCVLGVIAVESKDGRSWRLHAKRLLQRTASHSTLLSRLPPEAQGIAQIDEGTSHLSQTRCRPRHAHRCHRSRRRAQPHRSRPGQSRSDLLLRARTEAWR